MKNIQQRSQKLKRVMLAVPRKLRKLLRDLSLQLPTRHRTLIGRPKLPNQLGIVTRYFPARPQHIRNIQLFDKISRHEEARELFGVAQALNGGVYVAGVAQIPQPHQSPLSSYNFEVIEIVFH